MTSTNSEHLETLSALQYGPQLDILTIGLDEAAGYADKQARTLVRQAQALADSLAIRNEVRTQIVNDTQII